MYGWGKGAASHMPLVVSLLHWGSAGKAESVAGECPVGHLFRFVLQCPLTYWIQFPKPCCFIYTVKRIGAWGLGCQRQSGGKGFTICMCVIICVYARAHMSSRQKRQALCSHCTTPPPLSSSPSPLQPSTPARHAEDFLWYTVMS